MDLHFISCRNADAKILKDTVSTEGPFWGRQDRYDICSCRSDEA